MSRDKARAVVPRKADPASPVCDGDDKSLEHGLVHRHGRRHEGHLRHVGVGPAAPVRPRGREEEAEHDVVGGDHGRHDAPPLEVREEVAHLHAGHAVRGADALELRVGVDAGEVGEGKRDGG